MIRPRKGESINKLSIRIGKAGRKTWEMVVKSRSKYVDFKTEIKVRMENSEPRGR